MHQVNIHEAKTHLSRLVDMVAQGETVIAAKAGKPVGQRLGFLQGRFGSPTPVKEVGKEEIEAMFRVAE